MSTKSVGTAKGRGPSNEFKRAIKRIIILENRLSELDDQIRIRVGDLQDRFDALQRENVKIRDQIDLMAQNVARAFELMNAQTKHERHSGSRASPAGQAADKGRKWGAQLPGSFETGRR